jgi:multiple sugar transport system substrate-binding protein
VYRASPHQDAAWRLVEYLSAPEQQKLLYRLTGDLPTRTEAWEDSALVHNSYARAFHTQLERVVPTPKVPEWEQIAQKIAEYGDAVARGSMTVDEALPALDRDVNAMLEKRRFLLDRRARLAAEDDNGH